MFIGIDITIGTIKLLIIPLVMVGVGIDGDIGIIGTDLSIIGIVGITFVNNPSYNVIWNSSRNTNWYVRGRRGSRFIDNGNSNIQNTISRRYNNPRPNVNNNNNVIDNIVNDLRSNGNRVRVYNNPNNVPNNNIIIRNNNSSSVVPNNNSIRNNFNNSNINSSRPVYNNSSRSSGNISRGSSSSSSSSRGSGGSGEVQESTIN